MAPDDSRNIFYNTAGGGSKTDEQLPSMVLPVVFPHHLLMMAVASTASKLSNVKPCTQEQQVQEGMEINNNNSSNNSNNSRTSTCPHSNSNSASVPSTTTTTTTATTSCSSSSSSCEGTGTTRKDAEEEEGEVRLIISMTCQVEVEENSCEESNCETKLSLLLRFEDQMNRQLNCSVSDDETGFDLANELVQYGLISELDRDKVAIKINENLDLNLEGLS